MTTDQLNTRLSNASNNFIFSTYKNFTEKSLGFTLRWLDLYTNFADTVQIGNGLVKLYNKEIATVQYDEELNIPIFKFIDEYKYANDKQEMIVKNFNTFRDKVRTTCIKYNISYAL